VEAQRLFAFLSSIIRVKFKTDIDLYPNKVRSRAKPEPICIASSIDFRHALRAIAIASTSKFATLKSRLFYQEGFKFMCVLAYTQDSAFLPWQMGTVLRLTALCSATDPSAFCLSILNFDGLEGTNTWYIYRVFASKISLNLL